MFQSYALYPHMNVRQNMEFGLKMRGLAPEKRNERIDIVSGILGLTPYLNRKPAALSGGQRQRVALGRTMVREPNVFLMDEPLSNLDAKLRAEMRLELIKLHRRLIGTTVFVIHDQVEAHNHGRSDLHHARRPPCAGRQAAGRLRQSRQHLRLSVPRLSGHKPAGCDAGGSGRHMADCLSAWPFPALRGPGQGLRGSARPEAPHGASP
ncbi:ATP-binding cassette domain-containing protein [Breoghania sp.]|uniref:ABC transporter ATP-binding protein n=1 Tax=Breoghania sp. TaxID=2065378 RepID=UPI00261271B4|nr:ATP-binding cassette domain-containing protein [Breoghania sp.]MDJ0930732.1 ATP-binding cassette domain-containing protein [Breoghania sp.]